MRGDPSYGHDQVMLAECKPATAPFLRDPESRVPQGANKEAGSGASPPTAV